MGGGHSRVVVCVCLLVVCLFVVCLFLCLSPPGGGGGERRRRVLLCDIETEFLHGRGEHCGQSLVDHSLWEPALSQITTQVK